MKVVGLTGGIGSGKTTVGNIFKELKIPVYDSDSRAKALYTESTQLRLEVEKLFGPDIYIENSIDRKKLAEIVFTDKSKLNQLNVLVHPVLQNDFEQWMRVQNAEYIIKEAAILIESGGYKSCDQIIVVTANEKNQISRVMKRDSVSSDLVKQRLNNQLSDIERLKYADFKIENDGSKSLIIQVLDIHQELLKLFQE
jgi:dephospho-CoA kinase